MEPFHAECDLTERRYHRCLSFATLFPCYSKYRRYAGNRKCL